MKYRLLSATLAATMVVPTFVTGVCADADIAAETEVIVAPVEMPELPVGPAETEEIPSVTVPEQEVEIETVIPEVEAVLPEIEAVETVPTETETEQPEFKEEAAPTNVDTRPGTDIACGLTLNTMIDGQVKTTADFVPGQDVYQIQVGGSLHLRNVWGHYNGFALAFKVKNGKDALYSKSLKGDYAYTFHVNPEVVSVNEEILFDTAKWQEAFEAGSGEKATRFFTFMKCSGIEYDAATGKVTVRFTINENGTNMVSCKTLDTDKTSRPASIEAYSPAGAFYIDAKNFKQDAHVISGPTEFKGVIDMSPWMSHGFPIRFNAVTHMQDLQLNVPAATVAFNVENGTWADGSTDPIHVTLPMEVVTDENGKAVAAGTLKDEHIPAGMIAHEGFDQATGKWSPEINMAENAIVLNGEGVSASFTHSFDEVKAEEPKPEQPKPEEPKDEETKPEKPAEKPASKPGKPNTGLAAGGSAILAAGAAAAAGLLAILKKRK